MNQEIWNRINELLDVHCFKDENGVFYSEIYADYRDELSTQSIQKITASDCPSDTFYEVIEEIYQDSDCEVEDYIITEMMRDSGLKELLRKFGLDEDGVREYCREEFYVKFPCEHYLSQEVCIDIIVDAGDLNYDYGSNCFGPHYQSRDNSIPEEAGLLWLVRQQGYQKSVLKKFLANPKRDQPFLFSVFDELANSSSGMNALTFLVKMPLKEYFRLFDAINAEKAVNQSYCLTQRKGRGYITLSKDTTCGLYDPWCGSGSLLEIKLEKDVRLPLRLIDTAGVDGARGYSIRDIYGVCSSLWEDDAIKEIHPMKKSA